MWFNQIEKCGSARRWSELNSIANCNAQQVVRLKKVRHGAGVATANQSRQVVPIAREWKVAGAATSKNSGQPATFSTPKLLSRRTARLTSRNDDGLIVLYSLVSLLVVPLAVHTSFHIFPHSPSLHHPPLPSTVISRPSLPARLSRFDPLRD